ncbi:hypothetical protein D3C73_906520 [compost metagenome]
MHLAIACDHGLGRDVDPHDGGRDAIDQSVPGQAGVGRIVAHETQGLFPGVADDHRNGQALGGRVRIEGMARQVAEIQHGAEVDAAEAQDGIRLRLRLEQSLDRQGRGLLRPVERQAQRLQPGLGACGGVERAGCGDLLAAHGGGAVEQASGRRHGHQGGDLGAAARLSEQHDAVGVAAESRDVVTNPTQGQDQIQLADVA